MTITQEQHDRMREKALSSIGIMHDAINGRDPDLRKAARDHALELSALVLWYAPGMTVLACDEEKVRELVEEK